MTGPAGLEGVVAVRLTAMSGTVAEARVTVRRPTAVGRALAGRSVEEALRLVPLLYSVCGTAQGVAAVSAVESAQGLAPAPAHTLARNLLVLAETAASHGWQALMEWPRLIGEAARPAELAPLRTAAAAVGKALYPAGDALRPGGGGLRPDAPALGSAIDALAAAIAGAVIGRAPGDAAALAAWADTGATPAARLLARVLSPGLAGFGASGVRALPALPADWFADRLAADPAFSARPRLEGAAAITGPLARMAGHPAVAPLVASHGAGLAAHFAARLCELAELPARLRAHATELCSTRPAAMAACATTGNGTGSGAGVVETARGRLAHWVRLEGGRIADVRMVAPTEWTFASDGALSIGLSGATADDGLAARAGLLVAALDPCVAAEIVVVDGPPGPDGGAGGR